MPAKINLDLRNVFVRLRRTDPSDPTRGYVAAAAEWLRHTIIQSFNEERSPEGEAWPELSEPYGTLKLAETKGNFMLRGRTGRLSAPFLTPAGQGVTISGNVITAEADAPYAAAHQYGAEIHVPEIVPKNAQALRFLSRDLKAIFAKRVRAHDVRIPARPFLPSPAFAEQQAVIVIEEELQRQINEAGAGPGK